MTPRTALTLFLGLIVVVVTASPALAAESGSEDAGRRMFEANCAMCHGADATGMMGDGGMMDGGMMMGGGVMMLMMALLVLGFLVLVITAIVWLVRQGTGTGGSASAARQELDRRYAAGELDRDEYLQRRRDLEG